MPLPVPPRLCPRLLLPALAWLLTACSPTLDWRELRPEGSGAQLMLPCKPASHARKVKLAGGEVELSLYACSAGDVTWALAFADLADPARVGSALQELRAAALANLGADESQATVLPLKVDGATPNPAATRLALNGRLPDGKPVQEQVAVFSKGTRVFQATCVGAALPADAVQTFFESLRTPA